MSTITTASLPPLERPLAGGDDQLRRAFDLAAIGMALVGLDGRWLRVNASLCEMLGYDAHELMATDSQTVTHRDDLEADLEFVRRLLAGDIRGYSMEKRYVHKRGNVIWALLSVTLTRDDAGRPLFFISQVQDISRRKQAEEALAATTATLRAVIDASPAAIITATTDRTVTLWNRAAEQLFGWSAAEVVGHPLPHVPPEALDDHLAVVNEMATAGVVRERRTRRLRKDGSRIAVSTSSAPLVTDGRVTGFISVSVDISERERLETELRHAQKIEAVGRLAGGVAHDFNNILTAIKSYAQLLGESLRGDERADDVREIVAAADRAAALTARLLAFSRKQIVQPQPLHLGSLVEGMRGLLDPLTFQSVAVRIGGDPALAYVWGDPGQLEQLVMNLAVNANDAMPEGGTLTIATTNVSLDAEVRGDAGAVPPGRYVRLTVRDTGHGIDAAILPHVFEPFFTTKPPGRGTGLGLATVYGIVTQSGGQLTIRSSPGQGTEVAVYLPALTDHEAPEAEPEVTSPSTVETVDPHRGLTDPGETILVVDDEEAVLGPLARILVHHGYRVLEAAGGREALALATRHSAPIHLLITDVEMPEVGGRAVAEQLERIHPETRTLYISGYTSDEVVRRGVLDRTHSFLQKPFSLESLLRAVRDELAETTARL